MEVSDGVSEGPGDRAVSVGLIQNVFREGHRSVSVELREVYHERGESPLLTDPPADGAAVNGSVCLSELCCPYVGGMTHRIGDGVELAAIAAVGDPYGLAISKAGSRREAHRSGSFGTECIVAGRGEGSTLPVVGNPQRPDHPIQFGAVDVVIAVLANLPDGGAGGIVGDAVDPLNANGGKHHQRFGDQHRSGSFGTECIVADQAASRT